jgi:magnesium transporter
MLTVYNVQGTGLVRRDGAEAIGDTTVWIDLLNPTAGEDKIAEQALGVDIPTRAEMREIEPSNRLYQENGATYMTTFVVYNIDQPRPDTGAFTFILAGKRLVTVRYHEPKSLPHFLARAEKGDIQCTTAASVAIGLMESIIHREADLIEKIQDEVDRLALSIFDIKGGQHTRNRRLDAILRAVGKEGDINSRAQEAAFSLDRLLHYFLQAAQARGEDAQTIERIRTAQHDIRTLMDHARFQSERTTFLLDAALGMINTEQNQIIKLFSVVAVMLMPPTLVASLYGMNFKHMPELEWQYGYPMAVGLMILSGILPYLYFRRKGWL